MRVLFEIAAIALCLALATVVWPPFWIWGGVDAAVLGSTLSVRGLVGLAIALRCALPLLASITARADSQHVAGPAVGVLAGLAIADVYWGPAVGLGLAAAAAYLTGSSAVEGELDLDGMPGAYDDDSDSGDDAVPNRS